MPRTVAALGLTAFVLLSGTARAEDTTYRKHIRPLWESRCAACHGDNAPYHGDFAENKDKFVKQDLGPRMDTYADLTHFIAWPDTGALMRRLDDGKSTADKKPGNMYQHLGDDDAERQANLKVFKAWVGEDAWNLKRWNTRGNVPGITKEELNKLKVKY